MELSTEFIDQIIEEDVFIQRLVDEDSDESDVSEDDIFSIHEDEYEEISSDWVDDGYIEEIANMEELIPYTDCIHDKYYIGTYKYFERQNILLFAKRIHISTFYKYSNRQLSAYLYWYSGIYISAKPPLEIIQLQIDSQGLYSCVIKTVWLRIIQRRWKAVFHKERSYIKTCILSIIQTTQRTGKPAFIPKLRGLLYDYK